MKIKVTTYFEIDNNNSKNYDELYLEDFLKICSYYSIFDVTVVNEEGE